MLSDRKDKDIVYSPKPEDHFKNDLYHADGSICLFFLERINSALSRSNAAELKKIVSGLHQAELGDLLEAMQAGQRHSFIELLGDSFDFSSLAEVDDSLCLEIMEGLSSEKIVSAVRELDSDDAVYILGHLSVEKQEEILANLPFTERIRLRRSLDYPEESAGRRMQTEFVATSPSWTVHQTIDHMRESRNLPERFNQIFVIDEHFRLLGAVDLDRILRSAPSVMIADIMEGAHRAIPATLEQEEAAREFQKYDLLSAAVLDEENRLVGVLTIDDIVDVIQEEASEDLLRMGGVGDESLSDSILRTLRLRATWLFVNLMTAFLASSVISLFDHVIEQIVALAILMPVVAGMGGNAGSQTMTVAVRALANKDIDTHNAGRIIRREMGVGLLNGVIFASLMSVVASLWFQNINLGGIIAAAMVINMFAAALAGILIPLFLNRWKIDPAVASSVFVTMITDVIGFFSFLGLAAWWFGLP